MVKQAFDKIIFNIIGVATGGCTPIIYRKNSVNLCLAGKIEHESEYLTLTIVGPANRMGILVFDSVQTGKMIYHAVKVPVNWYNLIDT